MDLPKLKAFSNDKVNVSQNFVLWKVRKTLREKEKMLVTSIFSFSLNVFKSILLFEAGIVLKDLPHVGHDIYVL